MDVASLIAAQWMRVDGSAAMSACSRSRENVAMPHWRGGQVATNAIESALAVAVIKTDSCLDSVAGEVVGRAGLATQPAQNVGGARGNQRQTRVSGAVVQA